MYFKSVCLLSTVGLRKRHAETAEWYHNQMLYAIGNVYFSLMMQVRLVNRANFNPLCEVKSKLIPVQAMQANRGNGEKTQLINISTRWE
jgi:hypothetical protein